MAVRATFYKNHNRLWGSLNEYKQIRKALEGNDPAVTEVLVYKHIQFVSVDREVVGRNQVKRIISPEIKRDRSSRSYLSMEKAETASPTSKGMTEASGVRTYSMLPKGFLGTREVRRFPNFFRIGYL